MAEGRVYFLQVGTDGPIKIGFTINDLATRIRQVQAGSPYVLRWIGHFSGSREDERSAHLLLLNSHMRAEWFFPTKEVLAFVTSKSDPDFEPRVHGYDAFDVVRRGGGVRLQRRMGLP
jgi:hypothetical protein